MSSPEELRQLSALLDDALALPEAERPAWIEGLQGEAARLRPTLQALLSGRAGRETADLIDRGPAFTAPRESEAPGFSAGDVVGPWRLVRVLGRGGMGEVWLAERSDGQLKREVALKLPMLGLRRSVLVQRFARERDILGALVHPNIARLYDAGLAEDGQPYLALEYVDGLPITDYARAGALGLRERVQLLQQVMDAVQVAHANLVIHRDLKPSNVLVTAQGRAMLLDFGIAKLLADEGAQAGETELTRLGGRALTLEYAAPEQITGAPISTATDVYALGALLYELLAGQRPFGTGSRRELEAAILGTEPPRPRALPADLATIVAKALKKQPAERYATVDALAADLGRWLRGEPVLAQPDSAWYRTRRFVGRNRAAVATAAGVLLAVLAAAAVAIQQAHEARAQSRIAQTEAATAAAVQRFMEDVFRANSGDQVDPLKARRRTAKELLDEGAQRIDQELDEVPQAKLQVLKTLAQMYGEMAELGEAARLHARRAELAERLEGPASPRRVEALSDQATELISAQHLDDAARVLAAAEQAASAAGPALGADVRLTWLMARARLGRAADPAACVPLAQEAVAMLRPRPPSSKLAVALDLQGACLLGAGRAAEALAPLQESAALAQRPESRSTSTLAGTYGYLGGALARLERLGEAEAAYRAGIDSALRHHGEHSIVPVISLVNFAQFLDRRDRLRECFETYRTAVAILQKLPASADKDSFTIATGASASKCYAVMGRLAEAQSLLDEADAAAGRQPPTSSWPMRLLVRRAALQLELQDDEATMATLDRARRLIDHGQGATRAGARDEAAVRVYLELRRRRPQAAADAWAHMREVLDPKAKAAPAWADAYLHCLAQAAAPGLAAARAACEAAIAAMDAMPQTPNHDIAAARARWAWGRALLDAGQPRAAVPVLKEAVRVLDESLDPERSTLLIDPLLTLARAARASGDVAGAAAWRARAQRIAASQPRLAPHYAQALRRAAG